ncbi:meiosis-specific protein ASY3 [Malania oleifera]|uniref:meiosis-specific protein ASY3 n=1 Tax=Malania oleifera TaxID=397392 RepID=UPI0025AE3BD8|nr:meiosis-specific protein ASY3 [Malania oleifera]
MSDCRSFGGNYQRCSQTRKISIGIIVDSQQKTMSGAAREDQVATPNAEKATLNSKNSMMPESEEHRVTTAATQRKIEAPEAERSPWISTRPYEKAPTIEAFNCPKQASNSPETHSIQFFSNETSILESANGMEKKFDKLSNQRRGGKDGVRERVEEFSFAAVPEVLVSEKRVIEDKTNKIGNKVSEALKMKLREILGTVSSSQNLDEEANNLQPEQEFERKEKTDVNPRQSSDPIETESESAGHTIKIPVTRSLTRKRAPTKVQLNKNKDGLSAGYEQKHQENTFSFQDGWSGRLHCAVNGGSSILKAKRNERKRSRIEPRKIFFLEKDGVDKIEQDTGRSKAQPADKSSTLSNRKEGSAEKSSSFRNRKEGFAKKSSSLLGTRKEHPDGKLLPLSNRKECHSEKSLSFRERKGSPAEKSCSFISRREGVLGCPLSGSKQQKDGHQGKDFHQSPATKKKSPALSEGADRQEDLSIPSSVRIVDQQDDSQSPTLEIKMPFRSSSPTSLPEMNQKEEIVGSPALAERRFTVGDVCGFRTFQILKPDCYGSILEGESSVSLCSEDVSPLDKGYNGCRGTDKLFPKTGTPEKSNFMLHPTKRLRTHQETERSDELHVPSEQDHGDGLARAVSLFALSLERVKSRIKSVASKKSSEILMSAAEGIYLQLQNVNSQIQKDVGKLTSLNKSNRKCLEAKFQEQQVVMRKIHERFKDEVVQHLQDCRSTLEGLEAHRKEFNWTIERRKASHMKLLAQVEEAIEMQLNDAEIRITTVHKLVREKMLQLKHVFAECLKEGVLS